MSTVPEDPHGGADTWSEWLRARRYGGDPEYAAAMRTELCRIRDEVLDGAALKPGMTLLDAGTGEGLIAFGAIERIGPSLQVVFTDVSAPLLAACRARAESMGVLNQCAFHEGSAERLDSIADGSVDVVTARAVLAYVRDKPRAIGEFYRVLRPGGRVSIAEPVMQDQALEVIALTKAIADQPHAADAAAGRFTHLLQRWKAAQFPSTDEELRESSIANYNERDLLRWARAAGFTDVNVRLHLEARPSAIRSWPLFLAISPHPLAPTLDEILVDRFAEDERREFEAIMRPLIESGRWTMVGNAAYLVAVKPAC
jgi:arsenite methyltransferase